MKESAIDTKYDNEEWRPVVGYEKTHLVSNKGRVYSLLGKRMLSPYISNTGYYMVMLKSGKDRRGKTVHRLVAEAFICNPDSLPIVNHIDENKLNNRVENLEWCTYRYNMNYSKVHGKMIASIVKPVYQYDMDMNLVAVYESASDVQRKTGYSRGNIWCACQDPKRTRYNSHWSYAPLV